MISGAILWISESVFLYAVSLDSKMAVLSKHIFKIIDFHYVFDIDIAKNVVLSTHNLTNN